MSFSPMKEGQSHFHPCSSRFGTAPFAVSPSRVEVSRAGDELPGSSAQLFHLQDQTSEKAQDCKSGGDKL